MGGAGCAMMPRGWSKLRAACSRKEPYSRFRDHTMKKMSLPTDSKQTVSVEINGKSIKPNELLAELVLFSMGMNSNRLKICALK